MQRSDVNRALHDLRTQNALFISIPEFPLLRENCYLCTCHHCCITA